MKNSKTFWVALIECMSIIIVVSMFCTLLMFQTIFYEASKIMQNDYYAPILSAYFSDNLDSINAISVPELSDVTTVSDITTEIPPKDTLVSIEDKVSD